MKTVGSISVLVLVFSLLGCSGPYSDPPLHEAAKNGDLDTVKELVSAGVSVNSLNSEGATPLHWAAFKGRVDVARFLLSRGADVNARTKKRSTPLRLAKTHKQKAMIRLLEQRGGEE